MPSKIIDFSKTDKPFEDIEKLQKALDLIHQFKFEEARDMLVAIVDSGNDAAYLYLGYVYEMGALENPILDFEKAFFYFEKSASLTGSVDAYISMANFFREGALGRKDEQAALNIYLLFESEGVYLDGFTHWMLGALYLSADDLPQDISKAEYYFQQGWKRKHIPSLRWLSYVYKIRGKYIRSIFLKSYALTIGCVYMIFKKNSSRIRLV